MTSTFGLAPVSHTFGFASGHLLAMAPPVAGRPGAGEGATVDPGAQPLGPAGGPAGPAPNPFGGGFLFIMIGIFVLMILMTTMGQRKEKKRREEMLGALGRYDRVQTAGGMIGTIVELKDDEVVLKVDEATNTKVHVVRSAVQAVLKKGRGGGTASDALEPAETAASR